MCAVMLRRRQVRFFVCTAVFDIRKETISGAIDDENGKNTVAETL
jgi:hypothetical protein